MQADLNSESLVLSRLKGSFPVLSEESGGERHSGPTWIVDPLDGTVNYFRGIPNCCVSIALWDREPILGVVYDFNRHELFAGIADEGITLNGQPITVSPIDQKNKAICFTGFPVATSFEDGALTEFVGLVRGYKKVRLLGSAALSLAYVACGRGDVYRERDIRLWDVAAGLALVKAAGGSYQCRGNDPLDVLAHNGLVGE